MKFLHPKLICSLACIFFGCISLASIGQDAEPNGKASSYSISLQGVLNPIQTLRLATRDAGVLEEVAVTEGDVVKSGAVIAVLDSETMQAELSAAQKELQIAREEARNDVDLEYSRISHQVNEKIYQRSYNASRDFEKSVSKTELEKLQLESERSRLSKLQAERQRRIKVLTESLRSDQLKVAEIRLENCEIRTNINGTVVQVFHNPGEFVNAGEPIARILNLNRLRIVCSGRVQDLAPDDVPKEARFRVTVGNQELTLPAKVTFVSPEIDPVRQTYSIWAEVENEGNQLRSGIVGRLEFEQK